MLPATHHSATGSALDLPIPASAAITSAIQTAPSPTDAASRMEPVSAAAAASNAIVECSTATSGDSTSMSMGSLPNSNGLAAVSELEHAAAHLKAAFALQSARVRKQAEQIEELKLELKQARREADRMRGHMEPMQLEQRRQVEESTQAASSSECIVERSEKPSVSVSASVNTLKQSWYQENRACTLSELAHVPWIMNWFELYPPPPIPTNDAERCKIAEELLVPDEDDGGLYNDLCHIARKMLQCEVVLIDLVCRDEICFKGFSNCKKGFKPFKILPRAHAGPCSFVIQRSKTLVISNMLEDPAFEFNPITKLGFRFYCGSPLTTSAGVHVGVVAAVDSRPNFPFGPKEVALMELLASTTIKQLECRKQQIEANRMKDAFLANVSHELRSPLHGILGVTELLSSTPLSPLQCEYVGDIQQQSHLLLHIVSDLLDFARLQADRLRIHRSMVELRPFLNAVVRQMQAVAASKQIRIGVDYDAITEHMCATIDEYRLRQVFNNLLSNSIKFSPSGSFITVRAWMGTEAPQATTLYDSQGNPIPPLPPPSLAGMISKPKAAALSQTAMPTASSTPVVVSPSSSSTSSSALASAFASVPVGVSGTSSDVIDRHYLCFSVSDEGIGISSDYLPRLFAEFVQEDSTSAREHGGSGLGLSISRRLAGLMGGDLWLQHSIKGKGSTFAGYVQAEPCAELHESLLVAFKLHPSHQQQQVDTVAPVTASASSSMSLPANDLQLRRSSLILSGGEGMEPVQTQIELAINDADEESKEPSQDRKRRRQLNDNERDSCASSAAAAIQHRPLLPSSADGSSAASILPLEPVTSTSLKRPLQAHRGLSSPPDESRVGTTATGPVLSLLVVDDLQLNVKIASRLISRMGHDVETALSGEEAIMKVKQKYFDLVLMDVAMPQMSGLEATRLIREAELHGLTAQPRPVTAVVDGGDMENEVAVAAMATEPPLKKARADSSGVSMRQPQRRIKILAFTASIDPDERLQCLQAGMDDMLPKPLAPSQLARILQQIQDEVKRGAAIGTGNGSSQSVINAASPMSEA